MGRSHPIGGEKEEVRDGDNVGRAGQLARWRLDGIGLLRILFGIVWGIDAWFKWQPDFVNNFQSYLTGAQQDQPWPVHQLAVVIWSTAEGFGGPYKAGSTDIGAAIIYVLVFVGLFLSSAGLYYGLDSRLTSKLGRMGFLASGWFGRAGSSRPVPSPGLLSPS